MESKENKQKKSDLITIENLFFSYDDKEVLSDVCLKVPQGITMGILGPNGGGKTTLLKIILGLLKGYRGKVEVLCRYQKGQENFHHQCMGYVPQKNTLNLKFPATVHDTVEMGLYGTIGCAGPSKEEKEYIIWLLNKAGVWDIRNKSVGEISGGQLQRTMIARALVGKPALLALDEPMVGIDESGVLKFIDLLMTLKKELNLTVLMVSHNFEALGLFTDRVACINRTLHFHENPDHLTQEEIREVFACGYDAFQKTLGKSRRAGKVES